MGGKVRRKNPRIDMQIMGMGINYSTRAPLIGSMDEQAFSGKILESLRQNIEEIRSLRKATETATTFRGEIERERTVDLGDPRAAGWTFLVNGNDPQRNDIIQALRPLAEHRGMDDPEAPLIFRDESPDEWFDWLQENYFSLQLRVRAMRKVPHYILIVGGPDRVPFRFQSLLDSAASVGRVNFDALEDLKTYVEKVIHLEKTPSPVTTRKVIVFATDHGVDAHGRLDPTYFSRRYMAEPLAKRIHSRYGLETPTIMGNDATKANLVESLRGAKPALVYTVSHGLGAPDESLDIQKRYNGAICCQHIGTEPIQEWLFSADDVPLDEPFLEGAAFFQFACFGYGTPAESDFMHWLGNPELNAEEDFVAALPKRLLAHPRGPIAFIGHVDTAWLHGFADPKSPHILDRWHSRIVPFVDAVDKLLKVQPTGLAMANMNKRYDITNALLTSTLDRIQKGKIKITPDFHTKLAEAFITRSDAQNYMIFGDPAVRLRILEQ